MPPKRKALDAADPNIESPNTSKKTKSSTTDAAPNNQQSDARCKSITDGRKKRWATVSGSKNLDFEYWTVLKNPNSAFEFLCIHNPLEGSDDDDDDDDDNEDDDRDGEDGDDGGARKRNPKEKKQRCDKSQNCVCKKTAAALPSHAYIMTYAGLAKNSTASAMVDLRNPDAFGMYTFNDHLAYGAHEVVQNLLADFDEAFKSKDWQEARAVIEGMSLFMIMGDGSMIAMADDGDMMRQTAAQIVRMALTALSALGDEAQGAEEVYKKSTGFLTALYLQVTELFRDSSLLDDSEPSKAKTFKFSADNADLYLLNLAKRHGVTVPDVEIESDIDITMPKDTAKDPWNWAKSFAEYQHSCVAPMYAYRGSNRARIRGDGLDITTWTAAERKKASFDGKDPLPADMTKKLKEGLVFCLG